MNLRDYLHFKKISNSDFAKLVNYSPQYISHTCHGHKNPGRKFKELVQRYTNGEVSPQDWPKREEKTA